MVEVHSCRDFRIGVEPRAGALPWQNCARDLFSNRAALEVADLDEALARLHSLAPTPPITLEHFAVDPCVVHSGIAYVSGQVPFAGATPPRPGRIGADVSVEEGKDLAALCAANALYRLVHALGSLAAVQRILRVTVYINAVDLFDQQPLVADGASRALVYVLGDRGRHVRAAVGVGSLTLGCAVEVELSAVVAQRL